MARRTAVQIRNDRMDAMFERSAHIDKIQEAGLDIYALSESARGEIIDQLFNHYKRDQQLISRFK